MVRSIVFKTVLHKLLEHLTQLENNLIRLALVGLAIGDQRRIKHLMTQKPMPLAFLIAYFNDPEDAKTWLVGER
jgi:hypothetical protein